MRIPLALLLLMACLLPSLAAAQGPPPDREWQVRIGAISFLSPEYEGSSRYESSLFPSLDVRWRDRAFLNVHQGLGAWLLRGEPLRLGASLGYAFGRDEDENRRLEGLGDVEDGLTANLFLEKDLPWSLNAGLRLEHQVTGEDTGTLARLELGYDRSLGRRLMLKPAVGLSWASADAMEAYFGVTPAQAARSGLPAYDTDAGLKSAGAQLTAIYRLGRRWGLLGVAGWERLLGDAADSPVTVEEDQFRLALGLSYTF